jgi:hypothetical protein
MTRPERSSPIAPLKTKGDLAEVMVAADLMRRGYKIAFPYGEDWDYDLIVCRDEKRLERVQVKYTCSNGDVIAVRSRSASLTNGKVKAYKYYTAKTIDWLAVYDVTTDCCYYLPAGMLGTGMSMLHLRLSEARNNQRVGIRFARDFVDF